MANRNYGNDKVTASWLNIDDIREGCVGGADWFVDGGRTNPAFTSNSDRQGNTTQSFDARAEGTFTLTVLQSSSLFSKLVAIHNNDIRNRDQVGNFSVTDVNKDEKYIYKNARINSMPTPSFGQSVAEVPVEFIYEKLSIPASVVENIANIIGA